MNLITSPNTVLANSLHDAVDLIQPRIKMGHATSVVFCVGTQINGVPHLGTYLVQAASFVLAREVRQKFQIPTRVEFCALDNAPHDIIKSPGGTAYQRTYHHALLAESIMTILQENYLPYFHQLQEATNVPFKYQTYSEIQATPEFRQRFILSLEHEEKLRWCISPSSGRMHIRLPCPKCYYAEKQADRTTLIERDASSATFRCMCLHHGEYDITITGSETSGYLDLNTIYRNVIKEVQAIEDPLSLYVMVKGGDWALSTQPIDWALGILGYSAAQVPVRMFTPQIVTETGAKLSKSLIRNGDTSMHEVPEWILDMGKFREYYPDNYVSYLVWLTEQFLSHPRHMYRSYSYQEIIRILKNNTLSHGAPNETTAST